MTCDCTVPTIELCPRCLRARERDAKAQQSEAQLAREREGFRDWFARHQAYSDRLRAELTNASELVDSGTRQLAALRLEVARLGGRKSCMRCGGWCVKVGAHWLCAACWRNGAMNSRSDLKAEAKRGDTAVGHLAALVESSGPFVDNDATQGWSRVACSHCMAASTKNLVADPAPLTKADLFRHDDGCPWAAAHAWLKTQGVSS